MELNMRKITVVTLMFMCFCFLGFSSAVFAQDLLSTAGTAGELNMGTTGGSPALDVGLSPKVVARYVSPGNSSVTAQWYAMAAGHPGGNKLYCSGQNLNNIGSRTYATGTAFSNAILNIPATQASEDAFQTLGWDFD